MTRKDIAEIKFLISYLPLLYKEGFHPIKQWCGDPDNDDQNCIIIVPEYDRLVYDFIEVAGSEFWAIKRYDPKVIIHMLNNEDYIKSADLQNIKNMLAFCVRGERFTPGHWASMITEGYIKQILERLGQIVRE